MIFFSIITPIYNRSYFIDKIYDSLKNQTYSNFEWIIIDDGSEDNLKNKISDWNENFIKYKYINNSGKHVAVNLGIDLAKGDYSIILDSDDIPKKNALEIFNLEIINSNNKIQGIGCLVENSKNNLIGSKLSKELSISILDFYSKKRMKGDKWFLFKTDILKNNKFPIIDGEKFITEGIIHNRISRKNIKLKFINKILLKAFYNKDGYTANKINLKKSNPFGYLIYYFENITSKEFTFNKYYFYNLINIIVLILLKSKHPIKISIMFILAFPLGLLKYLFHIFSIIFKK
ncbi:glycosyltransferase family 2 protein [Alphaproteobacteria bacterium]|nr:glycosyltransferase family 2 protein [Alphaproteobacteria bacterium]